MVHGCYVDNLRLKSWAPINVTATVDWSNCWHGNENLSKPYEIIKFLHLFDIWLLLVYNACLFGIWLRIKYLIFTRVESWVMNHESLWFIIFVWIRWTRICTQINLGLKTSGRGKLSIHWFNLTTFKIILGDEERRRPFKKTIELDRTVPTSTVIQFTFTTVRH